MKSVDQLLPDGTVVLDEDQPLKVSEQLPLLTKIFGNQIKKEKDIRTQYILGKKIALLIKAVTYLGRPWESDKKRIQLSEDFQRQYLKNIVRGLETFYLGIYQYNGLRLYVVYEPGTYATKKSHNSSAHVHTFDLQYALLSGVRRKEDAKGNIIRTMTEEKFKEFMLEALDISLHSSYEDIVKLVNDYFKKFAMNLPKKWNGVDCYKEMMNAGDNNAKQGEWQGFYFEYLFKKNLKEHPTDVIEWCSDKTQKGIDFDLKFPKIPWGYGDLKADKLDETILGNSFDSFDKVIDEHSGTVYYIVCRYKAESDKDHNYRVTKYWNQFRGDPYTTEEEIKKGYGTRMKYSVEPKEVRILSIDKTAYDILKKNPMRQGINSNGKARQPKLKIDKNLVEDLTVLVINVV